MRTSKLLRLALSLALSTGCAVVLAWAGPRPSDLPPNRQALMRWLAGGSVDETIATLAALAAQLCLLYLAVTALLVGLARLPGGTGRLCDDLADLIPLHFSAEPSRRDSGSRWPLPRWARARRLRQLPDRTSVPR